MTLPKEFKADDIDLSAHTYLIPTNDKPVKVIFEGPGVELELINNIDGVCTKIKATDLEALKYFINIHFN